MRKNEAVEVTTIDAATEYHKEVISVTLIVRSRINILHKRERETRIRKEESDEWKTESNKTHATIWT